MKLSFVRDFELEFRKAVLQLVVEKKDENTLIFLEDLCFPVSSFGRPLFWLCY